MMNVAYVVVITVPVLIVAVFPMVMLLKTVPASVAEVPKQMFVVSVMVMGHPVYTALVNLWNRLFTVFPM